MSGGNRQPRDLDLPEHEAKYPEGTMFGVLPAYAFYARHVEGLTLTAVQAHWEQEDLRPALAFDDVRGLVLDGFEAPTLAPRAPAVWLRNVPAPVLRLLGPAARAVRRAK
jgi:hypothetical protein